ncbi:MAG: alpha/beta hydrolase [Anaerolineae bacterium]|nr:alpha/beta hydrolase [Anaerolineae bacterium]
MPLIQVEKDSIFYARHQGEGPAIILIHGAGGSRLHWPAALRRLPGTVYAIDLPGHGRAGGSGRKRIDQYAAGVVGLMNGLEIEQAVLIGHSMGGAIAQVVALSAPRRVLALVLLATGARLRVAPALLNGLQQNATGAIQLITQWAWGPNAAPDLVAAAEQTMLGTDPQVLHDDFAACDQFDVRDQIDGIEAPTLILTGTEDQMTPPRFGQWLQEHIASARFQPVEGAGHMLMLEQPGDVAASIEEFLQQL